MEPPSYLSADVLQNVLVVMPLHEFQRLYEDETKEEKPHMLTFVRRYVLKYGTAFPVSEEKFENEEDQYLFWAFYLHKEIGLKTHLFVDIIACMHRAIDLENAFLFDYYRKRTREDRMFNITDYALKHDKVSMIPVINFRDSEGRTFLNSKWQLPVEIARKCATNYDVNARFLAFANLPVEELPPFCDTIVDPGLGWMVPNPELDGLIISGDPRKLELVQKYFSTLTKFDWADVNSLLFLDDPDIFAKLFHLLDKSSQFEDPEGTWIMYLFSIIVNRGAVRIAKWLLTKPTPFLVFYGYDRYYSNIVSFNIDREKQLEALEIVLSHCPEFERTAYALFVLIRNSDRRALKLLRETRDTDLMKVALEQSSDKFLQDLITTIIPILTEDPEHSLRDLLVLEFGEAKRLINLGLPSKLIAGIVFNSLSYGEYAELLTWELNPDVVLDFELPSPLMRKRMIARLIELGFENGTLNTIDLRLRQRSPFKLFHTSKKWFSDACRDGNFEYLACKASNFVGQKFWLIVEDVKEVVNIKSFLAGYGIELIPFLRKDIDLGSYIQEEEDEERNEEN